MKDNEYEQTRQMQISAIVQAFAIPFAMFGNQPLINSAINAARRNDELVASLCYMADKSPQEIQEICKGSPYNLADIKAYYQMWGKFPE